MSILDQYRQQETRGRIEPSPAARAAHDEANTDDDALLEGFIAAACQHIDGHATWLGRALAPQVLEARLNCFPSEPVRLPGGNILQVVEVGYVDTNGVTQVAAADLYELRGAELGTAWGKSWPSARSQLEAVRIRYRAGYGALNTALPPAWVVDVPAPIKTAVLMHVAHLYANREAAADEGLLPVPMGYEALLSDFRIWSI